MDDPITRAVQIDRNTEIMMVDIEALDRSIEALSVAMEALQTLIDDPRHGVFASKVLQEINKKLLNQ